MAVQNQNPDNKVNVDSEISEMRKNLRKGRIVFDFDGMDRISIRKRAEEVQISLFLDRKKFSENKERGDEAVEESNLEDFYPNVETLCDKMIESANARFERAVKAHTDACAAFKGNFDRKQARTRRLIDEKYEASVKKMLAGERKKIDAQKKEMEKIIKLSPNSPYSVQMKKILESNEECYALATQYIKAQAAAEKYGFYQRRGVLTEEDKKISLLAEEMEESARLRLTNAKEKTYLLLERDAVIQLRNENLVDQAKEQLKNCEKDTLAFLSIPNELKENALQQGLWNTEMKYYDKLIEKSKLTGFHPFKMMALNREIKNLKEAYNTGRALVAGGDGKSKYPDLTTLENWQKSNGGIAKEKIVNEPIVEEVAKEPKQPKQLDLSAQMHPKKEMKEEIIQEEIFMQEKIVEEPFIQEEFVEEQFIEEKIIEEPEMEL